MGLAWKLHDIEPPLRLSLADMYLNPLLPKANQSMLLLNSKCLAMIS